MSNSLPNDITTPLLSVTLIYISISANEDPDATEADVCLTYTTTL